MGGPNDQVPNHSPVLGTSQWMSETVYQEFRLFLKYLKWRRFGHEMYKTASRNTPPWVHFRGSESVYQVYSFFFFSFLGKFHWHVLSFLTNTIIFTVIFEIALTSFTFETIIKILSEANFCAKIITLPLYLGLSTFFSVR